jgi:LuxR family transcriptional regulator, maltose regulon positive regulatory protein
MGEPEIVIGAAWMLSLSAKREEAGQVIAAAERLGQPGGGPLPDGFSSAEASLTMLRACCPWGDVGAQLHSGRRAAELEGPGSAWRPVACWAVGMGLYFLGEPGEADRWFAESAALAPASAQWPAAASSLAYRSLIAGETGRPAEQQMLAEGAAELVRKHGTEKASGVVPLALGVSLAARGSPEQAQPLIERGAAFLRSGGQPAEVAMALLHQGLVLRTLGKRERAQAAITEARSLIGSCPDPGMLTGRLSACGRSPQADTSSVDDKLTRREHRVLQLLTSDLSEREIGRELYVSHNTVHSHVRSIYRKLGVSSRARALQRTRELRLLQS